MPELWSLRRSAVVVSGAALAALLSAAPAHAVPAPITFGNPGDVPIAGDWNGSGADEIGVYRPANSTFYLRHANGGYSSFAFGNRGDVPIIGNWNGTGADEIGVYRPGNRSFYLRLPDGSVIDTPPHGNRGDVPIVGDWFGDGWDRIGVYRPANRTFYRGGRESITFGNPGDEPISINWDASTAEHEIGVYRPGSSTFHLRYASGATRAFAFGNRGDVPFIGDWDNDGGDDLGVYRPGNRTFYFGGI